MKNQLIFGDNYDVLGEIAKNCKFRWNRTHIPDLFAQWKGRNNWLRIFYTKCAKWRRMLESFFENLQAVKASKHYGCTIKDRIS